MQQTKRSAKAGRFAFGALAPIANAWMERLGSRVRYPAELSEPGSDYEGGEFVLVEQRPRMQSRGV